MMKKIIGCMLLAALMLPGALTAAAAGPDEIELPLQAETAVLLDAGTEQALYGKEMHRRMYPASVTKIMTALLALEHGQLDDVITMSREAVFSIGRGTSHIALDAGEELTLGQALYALALESANDAANGIAEHIGGTMENFAAMMNARAKQAGAVDTHFTNAHGLFDEDHYTTAYDMARITLAALEYPAFAEIFSTLRYEMPPTNKQPKTRTFHGRNGMLTGKYAYDGVLAAKTGYTEESGYTLVTAARRGGRTLVAVVMKSPGYNARWEDTTALLDYGFAAEISFAAEASTNAPEPPAAPAAAGTGPPESKPSVLPWIFGFMGLLVLAWAALWIQRERAAKKRRRK